MADPLSVAREALAGRRAWLVGGAVRDRALGRATGDLDVVVEGDPEQAARAIATAAGRGSLLRALAGVRRVARGRARLARGRST